MKYVTKLGLHKLDGSKHIVEVYASGRGGTYSPESYYLRYQGRWICPLEIRLKWHNFLLLSLRLKRFYAAVSFKYLVYRDNPFLKILPTYPEFQGKYIPVPLEFNRTKK